MHSRNRKYCDKYLNFVVTNKSKVFMSKFPTTFVNIPSFRSIYVENCSRIWVWIVGVLPKLGDHFSIIPTPNNIWMLRTNDFQVSIEGRVKPSGGESSIASADTSDDDDENSAASTLLDPALDEYRSGRYSPVYLTQEDLEPGSIVITEAEDVSKINVDQVGHKFSNRNWGLIPAFTAGSRSFLHPFTQ